jgi:CubicO group peptidase (beta-lactamase class C family)
MSLSLLLALALSPRTVPAAQSADLSAQLDRIFAPWDRKEGPGGVAAVIKDGEIIYAKGFGLASLEFGVPMTSETACDIGSTSKQFTAMAILLLEEDGKLSLDDDIQLYAPEIPTFGEKVTIRHILTHTSGLRDYLTIHALKTGSVDEDLSDERILALMGRQRALNFKPGTSWNYCNTGFWLAGLIVKRTSGKSLNDFCQERIFAPLGMTRTYFEDDKTRVQRGKAMSYAEGPDGWLALTSMMTAVGDGGLVTTVQDFAKWDANFQKNRLGKGSQELIAKMTTPMRLEGGKAVPYGLGLMLDSYQGTPRQAHGGAWLGYRSQALRLPEKRISVLAFGTDGSELSGRLADEAADLLLGIEKKADAGGEAALSPSQLERIVGEWSIAGEVPVKLFLDQGELKLEVPGQPPYPVFARSETELFLKVAPVTIKFRKTEAGPFQEAEFTQGQTAPMTRAAGYRPTEAELKALAGIWHAPELDSIWELEAKNGKLVLREPGSTEEFELTMNKKGEASFGAIKVAIVIDEMGRADLASIDAGRASGLILQRLR